LSKVEIDYAALLCRTLQLCLRKNAELNLLPSVPIDILGVINSFIFPYPEKEKANFNFSRNVCILFKPVNSNVSNRLKLIKSKNGHKSSSDERAKRVLNKLCQS
jgi:hypothetical protein